MKRWLPHPQKRSADKPIRIGDEVFEPDPIWKRLEKYPKWIRDYIHNVNTFIGAEEVQELTYLRDQNRQLIKLITELKAEIRRLERKQRTKKKDKTRA